MKKVAPFGPAPTAAAEDPPVQALDPSRRRLLQLLCEQPGTASPTLRDLVASVGGHPNTTRHHLRVLVDAGLVLEQRTPPGGGRGRPATRYAVTAQGRRVGAPFPRGSDAEEYVALAAAFAERLAERDGDPVDDARAIGKTWGTGLAVHHTLDERPSRTAREQVVAMLGRLGFSPELEIDTGREPGRQAGHATGAQAGHGTGAQAGHGTGAQAGHGTGAQAGHDTRTQAARTIRAEAGPALSARQATTVLLRTCPMLDAARRHPEVVCQVHLGLVSGALEANGESSIGVGLVPFARPGACELTLPATLVR